MKFVACFCAVFLLAASVTQARIGETFEQCVARYGEPIKSLSPTSRIFQRGGFYIIISFFNGVAESLIFRKVEQDILQQPAEISDNEIALLMRNNSEGKTWTQPDANPLNRIWITNDGQLQVMYSKLDRLLYITTKDGVERADEARKQREQQKLNGF